MALLADIHGNLPALQAALVDVRGKDIRQIWNLGDFVGYSPFPNEVIERVRAVTAVSDGASALF